MTDSNSAKLADRITALLGIKTSQNLERDRAFKLYEWWEWQERQAKYVINGQRSYDYFGHRWFLPLWADEYLTFWDKIGYEQKFCQRLYRAYLNTVNPCGVFRGVETPVWNWQGLGMMVLPIGGALRVLFGDRIANEFYHYASYVGKYHNHYAPFGLRAWLRQAKNVRSPVAFYVDTYLREAKIAV
jgi:asparagine synthase (glutamine-hydrolysing)